MSDDQDPFRKVIEDAQALHDIAMEEIPPDLKRMADDAMEYVLRGARSRPLTALLIAGLAGFWIASLTSK